MTRVRDWTLDSDDSAGGVTLNSDTITLGGRLAYWAGNEVPKPAATFSKTAKPAGNWSKVAKTEIRTLP